MNYFVYLQCFDVDVLTLAVQKEIILNPICYEY